MKTKYWQVRVEVRRLLEGTMDRWLTNAATFEVHDQDKLEPLFRTVSALLRNPPHYEVVGKQAMEFEDTWLPVGLGE